MEQLTDAGKTALETVLGKDRKRPGRSAKGHHAPPAPNGRALEKPKHKVSYGGGAQFLKKSVEAFNPDLLPGYSFAELGFYEFLTFRAWKKRSWVIHCSYRWLTGRLKHRRISKTTAMRYLGKLRRDGLIKIWKPDRRDGHWYLINPQLLELAERELMAHSFEAAHLLVESERNAAIRGAQLTS